MLEGVDLVWKGEAEIWYNGGVKESYERETRKCRG